MCRPEMLYCKFFSSIVVDFWWYNIYLRISDKRHIITRTHFLFVQWVSVVPQPASLRPGKLCKFWAGTFLHHWPMGVRSCDCLGTNLPNQCVLLLLQLRYNNTQTYLISFAGLGSPPPLPKPLSPLLVISSVDGRMSTCRCTVHWTVE
jgi:hypothetical protein